jgi:acyl carrier protein
MENRIKTVMADILAVSVCEINNLSSPRTIPSWKGQNHLKLIAALEKEFKIRFEETEHESLVSYKIISATIIAHMD